MNHNQARPALLFNANACIIFFLFKGRHLYLDQSNFVKNLKLFQTTSILARTKNVLGQSVKLSPSIVLVDCDSLIDVALIGMAFSV